VTFLESVRACLTKYSDFSGAASRSEYWWFVLFLGLAGAAASVVARPLGPIVLLATLLPLLAAGARRLHDTGRSGWLQLFGLVPVAGIIVLVFFLAQEGKDRAAGRDAAGSERAGGA